MMPDSPPPTPEPRLLKTLRQDWREVRADLRRESLRQQTSRTFADLQTFYLSAERREQLAGMSRLRRWIVLTWALLKNLLLKLTPARRILLAIAVVLVLTRSSVGDSGSNLTFQVPGLGVVLLLLLLALELKDKLLARGELEAGRAVQKALVPARAPALPGWDLWLFTRPANDVGGDLVDALDLGGGRLALVLADVAGKGLPAALLMAKLQATVRALAPETSSLDALAARVNRILHRDGLPSSFATLVYLELHADSDHVTLVNAGHMPPVVVGRDGLSELPRGGPALGLLSSMTYSVQEVSVAREDTLVIYTDGVTEAMDPHGEFFGDDRLRETLRTAAGQDAEALARRLLEHLAAFVADAPTHDDVSLVVARRKA